MSKLDSSIAAAVHIRRGVPGDAIPLAEFGARSFVETYGQFTTPADLHAYLAATYGANEQRAELEDPDCEYVLAERSGELAGFAMLLEGEAPPNVRGARAIEIRRFYVASAVHGTGVAAKLMTETVRAARRRGADVLWLGVWQKNPRAIRFYEKQEFVVVGTQGFLLGADEQEDLLMARAVADE